MNINFSIIIPVYNSAWFLYECLDSILAQTCESWECICIDDGSTDGSCAILDEYAAKDKRFRVIHQWFKEVSMRPFDRVEIPVPIGYDNILKGQFGDYMKLPPESQRGPSNNCFSLLRYSRG